MAPSTRPIWITSSNNQGISNVVLCGVTTAVCVHFTLREASDRGYDTLILEDCCGESDPKLHLAAIEMVKMEGGIFGTVATSQAFIAAIKAFPKTYA